MYRTIYDDDVCTWSPQGRIFQVEYAMEAVKQGSACLAARSDTHIVLAAYKRVETQKKIYKIDDQLGCVISGLNADARKLSQYMKDTCMRHKYTNETTIPTSRLVVQVANRAQKRTMGFGSRPFGVGLIITGVDKSGPHLYYADPAGNYTEYFAQAMGARSQASKTYLERHFKSFPKANLEQLTSHVLHALQASSGDEELDASTCSVAAVGIGMEFKEYSDEEVAELLEKAKHFDIASSTFTE
ncbi:putative Proteasome subunit alpha type-1-A [Monocercomonoides exilis]|uniref:putative Proteasome subunit alpha type-1-A n=1 Tax=Monocercomonoides exilis TaxID=2049356 RepID=UPI00355A417C|nr:putative Proteasome subunit alpha type-1-A [Monocercomonoides exilis]KAH7821532.1 putative Proteasome subunit alpha type-1-A [Monocercomonoides exilis]|eukprot:MONOS_4443.1-p1 / transcript=MONOS_4443.1 / gene=MONOS_4443 / organism=Monocercomonoides_exilis_PA203 / gene_product=Proteasome subunit alpha type-1-A / transcript_product=Proteasome subunit alpha type-1-A / location=Mono_scaffold00118:37851-39215(+) / protein_length=243 / sequence_SO=supercontig / SO=protein_coding / is_pseudo=false